MTKAINWPAQYLEDVINENTDDLRAAVRPGSIYYEHCYYVPCEIVDIRVNHKIIRPGIVIGEMKLCKINELSQDDFSKLKKGQKTVDELVSFLAKTYNQEVSPETTITIVYYKNLAKQASPDRADDPHM